MSPKENHKNEEYDVFRYQEEQEKKIQVRSPRSGSKRKIIVSYN